MSASQDELQIQEPSTTSSSYFSDFNHYVSTGLTKLYQQGSISSFISWGHSTVFDVGSYLLEGVSATSRTIMSYSKSPATQKGVSDITRMGIENVLPIAFVWGVSQFIEMNLNPCYGDASTECSASMNLTMNLAFKALQVIPVVFSLSSQAQLLARNSIMATKLPQRISKQEGSLLIREENIKLVSDLCADCKGARGVKNDVFELINYYLQLLAIGAIHYVPYVGNQSAKVLSVLLHGQFLLGLRLSSDGMCASHKEEYYREYFALCLAIGFGHDVLAKFQLRAMEFSLSYFISDLSLQMINWPLRMLDSLAFIIVLHNMKLPTPISSSAKSQIDPLYVLRLSVNELVDLVLPGIEKRVQAILAKKGESFSVSALIKKASRQYSSASENAVVRFVIPKALRDKHEFCTDPILKDYLEVVSDLTKFLYQLQPYTDLSVVTVINDVAHLSLAQALMHLALVGANKEQKVTPKVLSVLSGLPVKLINFLTCLLSDEAFIIDLKELTKMLEAFGATVDDIVINGIKEALNDYTNKNKTRNSGWHRAIIFKNLFEDYKSSDSTKYLLCLIIALNEDSTVLRNQVIKKVDEAFKHKNYFKKNSGALFRRFCDQLIEHLELEVSDKVGDLELSDRVALESSAKRFAAEVNQALRAIKSSDEASQALSEIKDKIELWSSCAQRDISKIKGNRQGSMLERGMRVFSRRIVPTAKKVKVSLRKEDSDKLTILNDYAFNIKYALEEYLRDGIGGIDGNSRAKSYLEFFNEFLTDAEQAPTLDETLQASIISVAVLANKSGTNMRRIIANKLSCETTGFQDKRKVIASLIEEKLFGKESNAGKKMLFRTELATTAFQLEQYANGNRAKRKSILLENVTKLITKNTLPEGENTAENKHNEENSGMLLEDSYNNTAIKISRVG